MNSKELAYLKTVLNYYSIPETGRVLAQFHQYFSLLLHFNKIQNLVAPNDIPLIVKRHFVDSLLLFSIIPFNKAASLTSVLDIGSGAGFPGLPLKFCLPDIQFTLLDAQTPLHY